MKVLLLGKNGQVGWELQRALAPLGPLTALDRSEADLERPESLMGAVAKVGPDVIVNAGAYTAVDQAEEDAARAYAVNAKAVEVLAGEAARRGIPLVHYSTDYVFDGLKAEPYGEDDAPNPLSVYGASKLAGERSLRASGAPHLILRTSWVYAARGRNFVRTMLRLARERDELRVVADQVGAPTGAELIADVTALILGRLRNEIRAWDEAGGTYHLTATGYTSWHGLAQAVLTEALKLGARLRAKPDRVTAIATADYPTRARRPANSRLATDRLRHTFGLFLPDWREGVTRTVREILAQGES